VRDRTSGVPGRARLYHSLTAALDCAMTRLRRTATTLALLLAAASGTALAQSWPAKPIRLVIGYTPGGAAEAIARTFNRPLEQALGQPLVFDYRPGAGATIGADATAKAPPDGYTLHLVDNGPVTVVPHLRKLPYDALTAFTPIAMTGIGGVVVVTHPSVPAQTMPELVALMRASPGKISYGTSGVGGAGHLGAELFRLVAKVDITHVPYKGGGPAITELLGGQIPMLFSSLGAAMPQIRGGKIRALAVSSPQRSAALPDVPTFAELGFTGADSLTWFMLVGPAGLPADIVTRVSQAMARIMDDKSVQDAIRALGYDPTPMSPAEAARTLRADYEKWGKVVREANIKAE
jgi:tripartite-type tricarboxylate transporter receptor subunit TctC